MNNNDRFTHHHIRQYSIILIKALKTPILIYFAIGGNFFTFSSAYLFYIFEFNNNPNVSSYWDAAWWALCTVSTVGYGDIYPTTVIGRCIGAFLILVGVTFFLGFMAVLIPVMSNIVNKDSQK